ncbi:CLAVATA3/ESR (CLE)-related protein 6 [Fagus crenata]|uniref:Uncharacterized protein n=1 Tax=Fagus sylvatica TaxID=28930 RepID=A0A2N9I4F1_FAGSY
MANFNVMKVSILIILLILCVHVSSLEALKYHGRKTMQKRINSSPLLRELGFHLSKMKLYERTAMGDPETDSNPGRLPPGGPDHVHNTEPPALMP